jgi:hypothetical protein
MFLKQLLDFSQPVLLSITATPCCKEVGACQPSVPNLVLTPRRSLVTLFLEVNSLKPNILLPRMSITLTSRLKLPFLSNQQLLNMISGIGNMDIAVMEPLARFPPISPVADLYCRDQMAILLARDVPGVNHTATPIILPPLMLWNHANSFMAISVV